MYEFLAVAIIVFIVADLVYADLNRKFKIAVICLIVLLAFIGMYLD